MSHLTNLQNLLSDLLQTTAIGDSKQSFREKATLLDDLTQHLLAPRNLEESNRYQLLLKTGDKINQELDGIQNTSAAANLSLIADAALRNIDAHLRYDLGTMLFDSQFSTCITGKLSFHDVGSVFNTDDSPSTRKAKEEKLQAHMKQLGLKLSPSPDNRFNRKLVLYYTENQQALARYFDELHAHNVEYNVRNNIIEDVHLWISLDKFRVWTQPEDDEIQPQPTDQLSEQEVHTLHKTIKDYLSILSFSYDKDGNFQPIAGEEVSVNLFRSYAAEIERILQAPGKTARDLEAKYAASRLINQQAHNRQMATGLALLKQYEGHLRDAYKELHDAIQDRLESTGMTALDTYLSQYGNIRFNVIRNSLGAHRRQSTLPHATFDTDDRELHVFDTEANLQYLLSLFADTDAYIDSVQLDKNRLIRQVTIGITDFRACGRLIAHIPEPPETYQTSYLVLVDSKAVRDVQICPDTELDPSADWSDWNNADLFLGIRRGTEEEVRAWAAEEAGTDPDNIRLIDLPVELINH